MKLFRRILAMCLTLVLVCLLTSSVVAANSGYTYTVRIFSGEQGRIYGNEVVVYTDMVYGDRLNFNLNTVTLLDGSKYYVKGIRESGRDNNTVGLTSFEVTRDIDYVVAYGILNNAVAYTINYLDAAGNPLAPSETYYGNVGDKPVIAYLYLEGYQPRYYNITGTLSENASENQFDFVYVPSVVPVTVVEEEPVEEGGEEAGEAPGPGEPAAEPGEIPESGQTPAEQGEAIPGELPEQGNPPGSETGETQPSQPTQPEEEVFTGPEEILDMDVPLAEFEGEEGTEEPGTSEPSAALSSINESVRSFVLPLVIALVVVLVLILLWLLLLKRKRKNKHE